MIRRFFASRWTTILFLIGLAVLIVPVLRTAPRVIADRDAIAHLENEKKKIEKEQEDIEKQKEYYQSEDYLVQQARLRLNYQKPDERVVFIYKHSPSPSPSNTLTAQDSAKIPWWSRIISFLTEKAK